MENKTMQQKMIRAGKWLVLAGFGALATVSYTAPVHSGPGSDTALADNRDMCSLPPFLNVSITEKPNIMIALDNSTSMSLPAYIRPYDPNKEYYGYYDARGCYSSNQTRFTKNPVYGAEVAEINGVWRVNPAWRNNEAREAMKEGGYRCDLGSHDYADTAYPYSGNFLNWATMRRIDLLRKAFTGGPGSSSGSQTTQHIAGEGAQQGSSPKAICFNKTYFGEGVTPFDINRFKVQDGDIVFGAKCPEGEDGSLAHSQYDPLNQWVQTAKARLADEAERRSAGESLYSPVDDPDATQVASLFNVMSDVGTALIAHDHTTNNADMLVEIRGLSSPAGLARGAVIGAPVRVTLWVENIGDRDARTDPTIVELTLFNADNSYVVASTSCQLPPLAAGASQTLDCDFNVPAAPQGYYSLQAYIDEDQNEHHTLMDNNTDVYSGDFYVHTSEADLWAKALRVAGGATYAPPGAEVTLQIDVANVGRIDTSAMEQGISVYLSEDPGVNMGSDLELGRCALPETRNWSSYGGAGVPLAILTVECKVKIPESLSPSLYENGHIGVVVNPFLTPVEGPGTFGPARNDLSTAFALRSSKPDFTVEDLTATPSSMLTGGDPVDLTFKIYNSGMAATGLEVGITLTDGISTWNLTSPSPDCAATRDIGAAASLDYACRVELPAGLVDGQYTITVTADPDNKIDEEDKTSNSQSTFIGVGTTLAHIDLVISHVKAPTIAPPGETIEISFRVNNIGSMSTDPDAPMIAIRLLDELLTVIASNPTCYAPGPIPAGSYREVTCSLIIPGTADSPGVIIDKTYALELHVNRDLSISESNYANNTVEQKLTIREETLCSDCTHQIRVNWHGRGRTGIFWTFRARTLGTTAPANVGFTKISSWGTPNPDGDTNGDSWYLQHQDQFFGVNASHRPNNNMVPEFNSTYATADGSLSRFLLNVVNYYGNVEGFQHTEGTGSDTDPMLYSPFGDEQIHNCRSNYIVLITDGYVYRDDYALPSQIPDVSGDIKDYYPHMTDSTAKDPLLLHDDDVYSVMAPDASHKLISHPGGTYRLDNVARYANWNDVRPDLAGKHSVNTVVVHAFADGHSDSMQARRSTQLMRATALAGNYGKDDELPAVGEDPDGYFSAEEGDDIGEVILRALDSILLKTASGTSVSVIAATARGEGAVYQSYFRPTTATAGEEVSWLGYLQALWVDRHNQLRMDSGPDGNPDGALVLEDDPIIEYIFDEESLETVAFLYDSDADGFRKEETRRGPFALTELTPIFEAGRELHRMDPDDRNIFTFAAPSDQVGIDSSHQQLPFVAANADILKGYMWPPNTPSETNMYAESVTMTEKLIEWTRGKPSTLNTFRNRRVEDRGVIAEWKLGDIVYSTPTIVGPPEERYDLLYGDRSYSQFFIANRDRRRLVIVGSNNGMLHAFNGGVFREGDNPDTEQTEAAWYDDQGLPLGAEVWAYVPGALLQNLRIYADHAYDTSCHLSSIDLRPKVTDVRIFLDSAGDPIDEDRYVNGWGTILVGGMRLGCGRKEFSSYFVLDITDPDSPNVLAEFSPHNHTTGAVFDAEDKVIGGSNPLDAAEMVYDLSGLNFSYFYPDIVRIRDTDGGHASADNSRWYIVVGSGPDKLYANNENQDEGQTGVFIFDLNKIGEGTVGAGKPGGNHPRLEDVAHVVNRFEHDSTQLVSHSTGAGGIMISGGVPADLNGDYNVDAVYMVTQHDDRASEFDNALWGSEVWRLTPYDSIGERVVDNPREWALTSIFSTRNSDRYQPIVAAPSISRDPSGHIWIYFGTGRFLYRPEGLVSGNARDEFDDLRYGTEGGATMDDEFRRQSLYGFVDMCWSPTKASEFGGTCPTTLNPYTRADLFDTTEVETHIEPGTDRVEIHNTGQEANCTADTYCTMPEFRDLVKSAITGVGDSNSYGWRRDLPGQANRDPVTGEPKLQRELEHNVWEMSFNKPAVAGGFVLFTTYVPGMSSAGEDTCALAGASFLHVLDYMGGVASPADVFGQTTTDGGLQVVGSSLQTDSAPPSPPAIYNNVVFVQSSTARPIAIETQATFRLDPRARSWEEE